MSRSKPRSHPVSRVPVAWDDPVPSGSSLAIVAPHRVNVQPHAIETAVRKRLADQAGVHFLELVVRRVPDGVCLEGVMQADDESLEIGDIVREIAGVERVINRLLILPNCRVGCEAEGDVAAVP